MVCRLLFSIVGGLALLFPWPKLVGESAFNFGAAPVEARQITIPMSHQEPSPDAKPAFLLEDIGPIGARARAEQAIAEFQGKYLGGTDACKDAFIKLIVARGFTKTAPPEPGSAAGDNAPLVTEKPTETSKSS